MDIGGLPNKIIGGIDKHATLLTFGAAVYLRKAEGSPNTNQTLANIVEHFTNLGLPTSEQISSGGGGGGYGALGETIITFLNPRLLFNKILTSSHAYSLLVKVGIAAYIAAELNIIPSKYGAIGKKVAMGAAAAAIVMPGSVGAGGGFTEASGSRLIGN